MRARLFARTGELAGTSFEIGDSAAIGRLPDNQVVLPGGLVSGHHCKITFDPRAGCYVLEDLGSRNGTFLAGVRVREPEKLGRLDVVNFAGAFDFIFQVPAEGAAAATPAPPATAPAAVATPPAAPAGGTMIDREIPLLPDVLAAAAEAAGAPSPGGTMIDREIPALPAVLAAAAAAAPAPGGTMIDGEIPALPAVLAAAAEAAGAPAPGGTMIDREIPTLPAALSAAAEGVAAPAPPPAVPAAPVAVWALRVERAGGWETFDLLPGEHVLGRGADCELAIDDRGLSRKHARLIVSNDRVGVVDLGSTNRTTVAGQRALPDEVTAVEPGAEIVFGALKAELIRKGAGS